MNSTSIILNFLVATENKQKEKDEINFNNICYLTQYIKNNVIVTYGDIQKIVNMIVYIFVLNLWNLLFTLYLEHMSLQMLKFCGLN